MLQNSLILSRTFPYSAKNIFTKYADPVALVRWWWPRGNTNTFEEFDFREWGRWVFTMHDGTNSYPNEWIFEKIEKDHIIMKHSVAPYFSLEVMLGEMGANETEMTWIATFADEKFLEKMRDFLIEKNRENFDRLEEELKNF